MADKLTATFVKNQKRPGKYADGGNLYLQVTRYPIAGGGEAIAKSWLFRYSRFGKDTWLGLGRFPDVTVAMARDLATGERRKLRAGIDPYTDKKTRQRAARFAHDSALTFSECATAYVDAHAAGWKNGKHAAQWRSTLENIAGPVFGHVPVDQVDTALVLRCLEAIWTTKTETASRLRGRIESVLDWATVRGYREGDNPARWRGHLDKLLPKPSKVKTESHYAALPYAEIGAFMAEVRSRDAESARALEFTILTAARTGEVIGAQWIDIDFDKKVWTIPAERMKAGREHRVPLSPPALKVLKQVQGRSKTWVFPGPNGEQMSNMAMLTLLRRMKRTGVTVHGFRSSFRDWCAEATNYPREIAEMALAHTIRDKTEAAYRRGDLLAKRQRLMRDWAKHCGTIPKAASVSPIRAST